MRFRAVMLSAVIGALALSACTALDGDVDAALRHDPDNIDFVLVEARTDDPARRPLGMRLRLENGNLDANAGGNSFHGVMTMDGGVMAGSVSMTATDVGPLQAERDGAAWQLLRGRPRWTFDGKNLVLATDESTFRFVRAVDPSGRRYTLASTSFDDGTGEFAPGSIALTWDGSRVLADAGCNSIGARITPAVPYPYVTLLGGTTIACEGVVAEREQAIVEVLGRLRVATFDGTRLVLVARDRVMAFTSV